MKIDVTDATFETDVLARSDDAVVVIDLWAPWCGPCRTLGPIIEKAVDATDGRAVLVKVNVDENPRISATFKVQSIPAVFALKERQIVDSFVGALPEPQVKAWLAKLAPVQSKADLLVAQGVAASDESLIREALELEPDNARAVAALAEMLVAAGKGEEALGVLAKIPATPETVRISAAARLGAMAAGGGEAGDPAAELESLLDSVRADDDARQRYLDLLALMGDDPRVPELRRKLAARLF